MKNKNDYAELKAQIEALSIELDKLKVRLEKLEPKIIYFDVGTPKWPESPLVCHCEDFLGDGFECERCGGMKF